MRNIAWIQQENSSMPAPLWRQLSSGPCRCSPWWEQKRLPRERCPTFATCQAAPPCTLPWRRCAGARGSEHSKVPQPGDLLPPWESSMCLAAILVIPAMGKRSPAERQLLAPEIIPKNPCIDFLPTQPPLLHHSANLFP